MIKIAYPGSNNFSTFVYDGYGRNISIVETTAGSVTSTKQFVWVGSDRKEERDGSGSLTKKFFGRGQINSTTKYFYDREHLGSVREMTDNSGVIQAQYAFDPFGRVTKISEAIASDFGYAGYYFHSRSGLNLTKTRAYSASLGRFITRDTIEERGGVNLFAYVSNMPVQGRDPFGLYARYFPYPNGVPPSRCRGGNNRGTNNPGPGNSNQDGWGPQIASNPGTGGGGDNGDLFGGPAYRDGLSPWLRPNPVMDWERSLDDDPFKNNPSDDPTLWEPLKGPLDLDPTGPALFDWRMPGIRPDFYPPIYGNNPPGVSPLPPPWNNEGRMIDPTWPTRIPSLPNI